MIQRIQSLYLLLTTILGIVLASGELLSFSDISGSHFAPSVKNLLSDQAGQQVLISQYSLLTWLIIFILGAIVLTALVTIGFYKKRNIQMILTMVLIILSGVVITTLAYLAYRVTGDHDLSLEFSLRTILPELLLLFSILAYLGILKDNRLIRSYERLR